MRSYRSSPYNPAGSDPTPYVLKPDEFTGTRAPAEVSALAIDEVSAPQLVRSPRSHQINEEQQLARSSPRTHHSHEEHHIFICEFCKDAIIPSSEGWKATR